MSTDIFSILFRNLDEWRHLPDYQLERRVDIFFTIFLIDFLKTKFPNEIFQDRIIPEFPIKKKDDKSNRTVKIDYLVASNSKVYFIELKTDPKSFDLRQYHNMKNAQDNKEGFLKVLGDLDEVYKATNAKNKYLHLYSHLEILGYQKPYDTAKEKAIEIIYIAPDSETIREQVDENVYIFDFIEIAEYLDHRQDESMKLFSKYLKDWTVEAGNKRPSDL